MNGLLNSFAEIGEQLKIEEKITAIIQDYCLRSSDELLKYHVIDEIITDLSVII